MAPPVRPLTPPLNSLFAILDPSPPFSSFLLLSPSSAFLAPVNHKGTLPVTGLPDSRQLHVSTVLAACKGLRAPGVAAQAGSVCEGGQEREKETEKEKKQGKEEKEKEKAKEEAKARVAEKQPEPAAGVKRRRVAAAKRRPGAAKPKPKPSRAKAKAAALSPTVPADNAATSTPPTATTAAITTPSLPSDGSNLRDSNDAALSSGLNEDLDWSNGQGAAAWLLRTAALVNAHVEGCASINPTTMSPVPPAPSTQTSAKTSATALIRRSPIKRTKGKGSAAASGAAVGAAGTAGSTAGAAAAGVAAKDAAADAETTAHAMAVRMHALADALPPGASVEIDVIWIGGVASVRNPP